MHNFVFFNDKILPAENTFLLAVSSAALYGKGIFTTVAVHDSMPFLWGKHWQRLTGNARKLKIDLSEISEQAVINALFEIIEKNNFTRGRARITFFDESPTSIWQTEPKKQKNKINLLIQTAEFRPASENFRLSVSPFRVNTKSTLAGVKSCNYLENILAMEDAKAKGFDEAVRLNEKDEIVSACMANIFWKKNDFIFTPSLETGCLEGTTRSFVLENFTVEERAANLSELIEVDEIFLTSAGIGIVSGKLEFDK